MSTGARARRTGGVVGKVILLVLGLCLLWSSTASAELFLKFAGIDGESVDINHRYWTDISKVTWGVSMTPVLPGAGSPEPEFSDLYWEQEMDKIVPKLFDKLVKGAIIENAKVDFTVPLGGETLTYFRMEFEGVFLTSLNLIGDSSSIAKTSGSFAYDSIKMTYTQYDHEGHSLGNVEAEYDLTSGSIGSLAALLDVYNMGMAGPEITVVPVPASILFLGTGLLGLGAAGWRRRRKG